MDWFWHNKGQEGVESFVTLCWQIWKARNEAISNSIFDPPRLCVGKALDWLVEYKKALSYDFVDSVLPRASTVWCRPSSGFIKVNVDEAFLLNGDKHGFGFVACDSSSNLSLQVRKLFGLRARWV